MIETLLALAIAQADPAAGPAAAPNGTAVAVAPDYELTLLAGAWIPRLRGCSSLGGGDIELDTQLDLDDWEPALNIEMELRCHDRWALTFGGTDFTVSNTDLFTGSADFGAVSLADGDTFYSAFQLKTVFGEMAFANWRPFASSPERLNKLDNVNRSGEPLANLRFSPVLGSRWIDVNETIVANGARQDAGGQWVGVYAGFQITLDYEPELHVIHRLRLQAALGLGPALAADVGFMWQVQAGVTLDFTENLGLTVGYRLLEMNVSNEDYELVGGLQGIFLAGSLRF